MALPRRTTQQAGGAGVKLRAGGRGSPGGGVRGGAGAALFAPQCLRAALCGELPPDQIGRENLEPKRRTAPGSCLGCRSPLVRQVAAQICEPSATVQAATSGWRAPPTDPRPNQGNLATRTATPQSNASPLGASPGHLCGAWPPAPSKLMPFSSSPCRASRAVSTRHAAECHLQELRDARTHTL